MCSVQNSKCVLFQISKSQCGGGKVGVLQGELEVYASPMMFPQSYGRESRRRYAVVLPTDRKFVIYPDAAFPTVKIFSYVADELSDS